MLLKIDGVTILTDPVFSKRAGIGLGPVTLGIKRIVDPALAIAELPKIDVVLLSHAHMDHFDIPSLRRLEDRGTTVVTAAAHRRPAARRPLRRRPRTRLGRARAGGPARGARLPGAPLGRAHAQRHLSRL